MSTPPDQPEQHKAKKPIELQLDELLIQIEEAEPGVIDPGVLPASYNIKSEAAPTDEAAPSPAPAEAAPKPAAETTPEQADMLAALNSALQEMSGGPPADETSEPEAQAPAEPATELSMEEKLQQEIASLINGDSKAEATPATDTSATAPETQTATASAENEPSTEDQIAMEIEGLLNASDKTAASADAQADQENAIDELDNMLASEIDADDELAGDFQTVDDVTAGIQVPASTAPTDDDEHAATARDVAAELDSQPEDLPAPPPQAAAIKEPAEDPFAVLSEIADTAEKNEAEHQRQASLETPKWQRWLAEAKDRLFAACYLINWPARRLSAEWRANIGYIALLNLFFGVGLWIVLLVF
jgi:hypothetical protein